MRAVQLKEPKTEKEPTIPSCKYNDGVACETGKHYCDTCGWNPKVAWARLRNYNIFPDYESIPTFGYLPGAVVFIYSGGKVRPYSLVEEQWRPTIFD